MSTQQIMPTTTYPSIVGEVISRLRDSLGMRQPELANGVGVTQATWSRIENGASALTIEQLAKAATALGVTPAHILSLADQTVEQLRAQGVRVEADRVKDDLNSGIALLGAAALGGVIMALLMKSK